MKVPATKKPNIRIAVVESDPLRVVGFRALLESEPDLELFPASLPELAKAESVDIVLLGSRTGSNLFDVMAGLKAARPDLRILVTGSGADDETILKAVAAGAKGYVEEAASAAEFIQAIRIVHSGSVWAPRRVLSMFIERVTTHPGRIFPAGRVTFTDREKEVLELLVAGRSNKEIGSALNIEERTVKAHVAKLMRKVGVQNRIALSVHAITHSLVSKD
jgi:DNA-binding NarL/FixJ family response regulator